MRIVAMIGRMDRDRFAEAMRNYGRPAIWLIPTEDADLAALFGEWLSRRGQAGKILSVPKSNPLRNAHRGEWLWAIDKADEVLVVCNPDGSLGPGTVDELRHAMGLGKLITWA